MVTFVTQVVALYQSYMPWQVVILHQLPNDELSIFLPDFSGIIDFYIILKIFNEFVNFKNIKARFVEPASSNLEILRSLRPWPLLTIVMVKVGSIKNLGIFRSDFLVYRNNDIKLIVQIGSLVTN